MTRLSPSASYRLATEALDVARRALRDCDISEPRALDAWTAVTGGLAAQQNANEPGGDRWVALLDEVIDMFFTQYRRTRAPDQEEG